MIRLYVNRWDEGCVQPCSSETETPLISFFHREVSETKKARRIRSLSLLRLEPCAADVGPLLPSVRDHGAQDANDIRPAAGHQIGQRLTCFLAGNRRGGETSASGDDAFDNEKIRQPQMRELRVFH